MYLVESDRLWGGGDKGGAQMISELNRIIGHKRIVPNFQPIINITDGKLFGFEALSRIDGESCFANIEELFTAARQFGVLAPLEFLCREKAIVKAAQLGTEGRLFLNVCPAVLASDHRPGVTAELLGKLGIERSRVVLEITEKSLISDYDLFNRVVSHYRQQGYAIAIDDLGDGYAGLKMLAQLEPDYVKLARFLVDGIDRSYVRQALVEAITGFCGRTGIEVIAEGIEQPEELVCLQQLGVKLGQGYLIGRPSSQPNIPVAFHQLQQTVTEVAISL
jgi:EAL domain-containing protein (putative c-di-GMP-specific phosphodiesterase class I)